MYVFVQSYEASRMPDSAQMTTARPQHTFATESTTRPLRMKPTQASDFVSVSKKKTTISSGIGYGASGTLGGVSLSLCTRGLTADSTFDLLLHSASSHFGSPTQNNTKQNKTHIAPHCLPACLPVARPPTAARRASAALKHKARTRHRLLQLPEGHFAPFLGGVGV